LKIPDKSRKGLNGRKRSAISDQSDELGAQSNLKFPETAEQLLADGSLLLAKRGRREKNYCNLAQLSATERNLVFS
jgi:hypothetical protein